MKVQQSPQLQSGVALALSLLLLLVLTIIGVAAMNSTVMQERMAGNLRMQTQVFEVASEGVTRALDYYYRNTENIDEMVGHGDSLLCGFVHSGQNDPYVISDQLAWRYPEHGGFDHPIELDHGDGMLRLEQQMYCCRSWSEVPSDSGMVDIENPSKLFVLSRGTFLAGDDDQELAIREVEVRLDEADPGNPTCAFCIPGEVGDFSAGNSNALSMHGACGPAITTQHPEGAGTIIGAIDDKKIGNYDGGITHGDMGIPWNDPNLLAEFIWWTKMGLPMAQPAGPNTEHAGYWDNSVHSGFLSDDGTAYTATGNRYFGVQPGNNPSDFGEPRITYLDRGVDLGGSISGHGIMIVTGSVKWGGTPDFEGLLIGIGGEFSVAGGGGGGNPRGSIIMTKLEIANSDLEADVGGDLALALGNWSILPYPVAADDDEFVKMYYPEDFQPNRDVRRAGPGGVIHPSENYNVPVRPVLRDSAGRELIHYFDPDLDPEDQHRFFYYTNGAEVPPDEIQVDLAFGVIEFVDPDDPTPPFSTLTPQSDPPRDKFGRLIPNFVPFPGLGRPYNWPHDAIEYHPNRWGWGLCGTVNEPEFCEDPPFEFGSSNFNWNGGGNQAFTYDCRWLQRLRQRLLCAGQAQIVDGTGDFPPSDYEYDDPDYSLVCEHHEWATEYNDDVLVLDGSLHNNHAWHLWDPKCECLGITADSDMILSGWRENLGWRDDDFAACAGLPGPTN